MLFVFPRCRVVLLSLCVFVVVVAVPQKRVSFVMTSTFVDDPDGEVAGKPVSHRKTVLFVFVRS